MEHTVRRPAGDARPLTTGQRLSLLMAARGVTARGLAAHLRIQQSTLANFRKGFRRLPPDVVARMAGELDTNVDFLLARSEDARPEAVIRKEAAARAVTSRGPIIRSK
jgi:transcriptional regulator with XRE-family HTH domain